MARTNIEIDDRLDFALRRLVSEPMSREEALAMEGAGWTGDLETMRAADDVRGL